MMNYNEWQNVMPGRKRISLEEVKRVRESIIAYIQANPEMTYRAIGELFGYERSRIAQIAREAGMPLRGPDGRRRGRGSKFDYEAVADYYAAHPEMTTQEVSDHFGMDIQTLRKILRETGTPRRSKSQVTRTRGRGTTTVSGRKRAEKKAEVVEYLREFPDLSQREIAEALGLSQSQVSRYGAQAGLGRFVQRPYEEEYWETPWGYRNPQPRWNIEKHRWE